MTNSKPYDLEERTLKFAKNIILFTNLLPKTPANSEIIKQVIRSSGSVGANYIEANEALGKKDFAMRIRICRKEAKETIYWLKLVETNEDSLESARALHVQEATELMKIFGAIITKTE
ncbi:MAG: four helix bundle protein [Dehalococcoidales bacterium]